MGFELSLLDKGLVEKVMEIYHSLSKAGSESLITLFALGEAKAEKGDYPGSVEQFRKVLAMDGTKLDAVIQGYEKILQRNPQAGPIFLALADARIEKGQASEAILALRSALGIDQSLFEEVVFRYNRLREALPDDPEVRDAILEALVSLKVYDQAQEQAEQAIASGVEAAYPHLALGRIQLEKGELTKSVTNLLRAMELKPELSKEVLASLQRIIAIDQGNIPAHYVLAKVQAAERSFDQALDEYQWIARLDPQHTERVTADIKNLLEEDKLNARGHFILAELYLQLNNPLEASLECDRTVDLDPQFLGKVIPFYQEIAARDPENAKANFALGKVQVQQGAIAPAMESFRSALAHDKTLLEPAIFELRKVLDQDPQNCAARHILAGIYRERNQRDQAAVLLQEILNLDPYGGEAALRDLESLLAEDPKNIQARLALAEAYLARQDLARAVDHLESLADEDGASLSKVVESLQAVVEQTQSQHPGALFALGKALLKSRQVSEGIQALDLSTRRDPEFRSKAIPLLDQALTSGLREPSVFKLLGLLRLEGREYLKSAETLLAGIKAAKEKSDSSRLYLCLSRSLAGLGDMKKSREALLQAHRMAPDARVVEEEFKLLAARRLEAEIQDLRKAVESKPADLPSRHRLSRTLSEAGRYEEALSLLAEVPVQDPEARLALHALAGRIHRESGKPGLAVELLRVQSLSEGPLTEAGMEYCYELARAYEASGHWPQAFALYQRVASRNPGYEDIASRLPRAARQAVALDLGGREQVLEKIL